MQETLLASVGAVAFGGFGAIMIYVGITNQLKQRRAVRDSVSVVGTVTNLEVDRRRSSGGRNRSSSTSYYPMVEYEYRYRGETYAGDDLYPGNISKGYSSRSGAESVLEAYDGDGQISLYVESDDPEHAFVHRRTTPFRNVGISAFGVVFFGIGIAALLAAAGSVLGY